jgi:putative heme-binding domain-containing protein
MTFQSDEQTVKAAQFLYAVGGKPQPLIINQVNAKRCPHSVSWAVRFSCEDSQLDKDATGLVIFLALTESKYSSPVARLAIASNLQKLPPKARAEVLAALLANSEDASDHNLPLMYWYALEPLLDVDANRALELGTNTKIPNILAFSVRKLAMIGGQKELDALAARLDKTDAESAKLEILRGMTAGLKGRRGVPAPAGWDDVSKKLASSPQGEIASLAKGLSVVFGSKAAMADLKAKALDAKAPAADRVTAIESLVAAKDPSLAGALQQLLDDPTVRGAAIRGLATYDDPNTPAAVLGKYASLTAAEKKDALLTLSGRPAYAKALLGAVGQTVPATDFTADVLRQLRNLKNSEVEALIGKHWAAARETEKDKLAKIGLLKAMIGGGASGGAPVNVSVTHGRALFAKTCAQCHTLFNEGGKVGPDITGSDRANLDYILTNIVDPNALIPADYLAWDCNTTDDRSITGILKKQDDRTVVLQTANEIVTLPRSEVKTLKASKLSMMPEGLLDNLPEGDIKDLIAYLRSPVQVALLADVDAAKTLFNGKDLTGWEAIEEGLYSVENGEIVGRTKTGIKKNQFLTSKLAVKDFRLVLKIKLSPDAANSGIQFRSVRLPGSTEMRGCQADAGKGWWGKLYEESGRALLFPKKDQKFDGDSFVNKDDWNTYEVLAVGGKIRTAINGHVCTDIDDDQVAKEGIFGLQIHSGGPTEVRFKDFELEVDPKFELKTVK